MSEYHTDKKHAMTNAAPLFASSWLALFYLLRENYIERRANSDLDKQITLINDEIRESVKAD